MVQIKFNVGLITFHHSNLQTSKSKFEKLKCLNKKYLIFQAQPHSQYSKKWIRRSHLAQCLERLRLYVWLELQVDIQGFVRKFLRSALYKTFLSSLFFVLDINTSLILEIFTLWFSPLRTGLNSFAL